MLHPILYSKSLILTILSVLVSVNREALPAVAVETSGQVEQRLLYVGTPGIRDYLEYGGHGVLVFDIDHGYQFVKRIAFAGVDDQGKPLNVKGIAANATTKRLYITTTRTLTCLDLVTEKVLWEKPYEGGCDRLALSPDGQIIYLPSLEQAHWFVLNALSGEVIKRLEPGSGAHNTIYSLDGKHAYLAGLKSPVLRITDTTTHTVTQEVGPFSNVIRPFTVNGAGTRCLVNVNELLGFEVGDLVTGKMLYRVAVQEFKTGPTKRHGCPSHGIGLTPDEKEIWLCDSFNRCLHIFDATTELPKQIATVPLRDEPGWITFSIDGHYAYPSTGEVVETTTRKIITTLKDEHNSDVQSEKLLEIDFVEGQPVRAGNQFGLGRKRVVSPQY
jgi:DNA-binding beta-propeller fold protein YncE